MVPERVHNIGDNTGEPHLILNGSNIRFYKAGGK